MSKERQEARYMEHLTKGSCPHGTVLTDAMLVQDSLQWVMIFNKGPENSKILMVSRNQTFTSKSEFYFKVLLHKKELFVRKHQSLLSSVIYLNCAA
jgi:hypothetical protein